MLTESLNSFINVVPLSETKRKKTKKRNVLKHLPKVTAQPDVPGAQAGMVALEFVISLKLHLQD